MTRARRSSRFDALTATLGLMAGVACACCASSPRASETTEPSVANGAAEGAPRRPDGVWLEPSPAIPAARGSAVTSGEAPVIALQTPLDRARAVAVVHRLFDAMVRNDEHAAEALALRRSGSEAALPSVRLRVLLRSHDYTKLAGQRIFRDENVRVRRANEEADGGVHDAGPDERDTISVRVPIDVNQAGGEVLFGNIVGLELVEIDGVLFIRDLDLNAEP